MKKGTDVRSRHFGLGSDNEAREAHCSECVANGDSVPLDAISTIEQVSGPEFTLRYNEYRSAQINGSAAPGYSSLQAMSAGRNLPANHAQRNGYDYLGISFQEKKAQQGVPPAAVFGLSILFVFLILAVLYESWSLPFSVLLGTPVAVLGAFLTLWIRDKTTSTPRSASSC